MPLLSNNTERSLKALCELVGVPTFYGWQKALGERLGIKPNVMSTWIRRNRIPRAQVKRIEGLGYPLEKWIAKDSVSLRDLHQARLLSNNPIEPKNLKRLEEFLELLENADREVVKLALNGLKYLKGLMADKMLMQVDFPKTKKSSYADFSCPKCGGNRVLALMRKSDINQYGCNDCGHTFTPEKKTQSG